ncbi:MAG: sulfotransferase [Myxococcota bacterium]|nr:sulfotransferase [Myxococcota bacterium]
MSKLVYIASCQRSGSTMLDTMLNGHPRIQSVGEVHRLVRYAITNEDVCTCGDQVTACEFWSRVEQHLAGEGPITPGSLLRDQELDLEMRINEMSPLSNLMEKALLLAPLGRAKKRLWSRLFKDHARAITNSIRWYEAISQASNTQLVLDSSKDIRRMLALSAFYGSEMRVLYIIRDGRGVVNSMRKRLNLTVSEGAKRWAYSIRAMLAAEKGMIGAVTPLRVRYEDLCNQLEPELDRICEYIGVDHPTGLGKLNRSSSHNIAGSPTRLDKDIKDVTEDLSWQRELNTQDLLDFERACGDLNKRLGYL